MHGTLVLGGLLADHIPSNIPVLHMSSTLAEGVFCACVFKC